MSLLLTTYTQCYEIYSNCEADVNCRGFFGQGDMQKEFEEASFALKPGEISQVVQTASGLHLIERYVE